MTQQALLNRLSWLHANYGPAQTKTAEAYFYNLTNDPADVLSEKFVKLAELQGMDPWGMAFDVAQSYSEIEKTASFGWPMSQYYLQWADDIEKDAFVQAARNLLGAGYRAVQKGVQTVGSAVGKRSAGALGQVGDTAAVRAAGNVEKSMAAQGQRAASAQAASQAKFEAQMARNAEKQTLKVQNQAMKSMDPAQRVAYREQRMAQQAAKAPAPAAPPAAAPAAPAAPPATAAPAAAAGTPAAAAPAAGAPTTGAAATPGKPGMGHIALGAGATGLVGAGLYGGYRLARGPSQGGAYQQ